MSRVLVKPTLASGVRINVNNFLKSIAPTGAVYVRLLVEDDPDEVDSGIQRSLDEFISEVNENQVESIIVQDEVQSVRRQESNTEVESAVHQGHGSESPGYQNLDDEVQHAVESADDHDRENEEQCEVHPAANEEQRVDNGEHTLSEADYIRIIYNIIVNIIDECKGFQNPVLILKKARKHILVGRQLDVVDPSTELKGKTNFLVVERDNLFQDALAEISLIDNLRLPLEVNFMEEGAQDFGGPRKEFFRLVLKEIKEKLFDSGLNEDFAEQYYISGIIMA